MTFTHALDGTELKVGDEVIIARQPADPDNDLLWVGVMFRLVGRRGTVDHLSGDPNADVSNYGAPTVHIRVDGTRWWFRVSELSRPATYHQAAHATPTEFPNLVAFNETTGLGPLHPACRNHYNPDWLANERRLCPYDTVHGTLSLHPGFDAYLAQVEFNRAQRDRRERFSEWRHARYVRREQFLRRIRNQLATHPFDTTKKGRTDWRYLDAYDLNRCISGLKLQKRTGRAAARLVGRLVGHFHPTPNKRRVLPDDEVFALLHSAQPGALPFHVMEKLKTRTDQLGAAYRAYTTARDKISRTCEWQQVPWDGQAWFDGNGAARNRIPHISTEKPQEVAYYQSVDKLIRGIETRTKPGRFLAKFFPNLTPDQVRQYANDYLVATAPKQLHVASTADEIIMAINEGPGESCQSRHYYDGRSSWYRGHDHPAAAYASGDFEVLYITDDNKPGEPARLAAETQRITARVICNAKDKLAARIYGDHAKIEPLLTSAGYEQTTEALVGCRLLRIYDENGSGSYIMPYVDAGIGSGGGCLHVVERYDHDNAREVWLLTRSDGRSTYAGYDNKGLLDPEERYTCPRCDATHDSEDDIHYSGYEEENYCSECEDDFVRAIVRTGRYGHEWDMVFEDNAEEIDGGWYANDDDLLERCGFVQCIHCDGWTSLDNTTTTDSGQVCCAHQVVELAEASPDGNDHGYRPDCTQHVDVETGETVWLDDNTEADDFTTDEDTPKYVSLDTWRDVQQRQASFEFVGPPKQNPETYTLVVPPVFDDLRI